MLAFTVLSLLFALVYASGWARLTREDYRHQELEAEIEALRASNAQLRLTLDLARSPGRIAQEATRLGMRAADPARDLDYAILPRSGGSGPALAGKGPARLVRGEGGGAVVPVGARLSPGLMTRRP